VDPDTRPDDLGRPGHIFPLKAKRQGVLRRAGHTEAAVDLANLSGPVRAACGRLLPLAYRVSIQKVP